MRRLKILFTLFFFFGGALAHADVIEYFANADAGRRLEFGGADDGAFADGPTQAGMSVVGATITVDTSVKSIYQFSSFTLSAGHTLNATGSAPLIIRVIGRATIAGTIHLDGSAGGISTAGAPGAGGTPGAGGGTGGLGGNSPPTSMDGANGTPRTGSPLGGTGGLNKIAIGQQQEGGGGCNGPGATSGANNPGSAAVCPLSAAQIADRFETAFFTNEIAGGGGGGGGGTQNVGGNATNGAGGGGAGGALVITATENLVVSGTITANGASGGAGLVGNNDYGSSGGGGSGGSIWLQSAAQISGAGTLTLNGGVGGVDGGSGSTGGNGSRGVVRIDATTPSFSGTVTGGAVNRTYNVFPVTVEFGLSAGPACGTIGRTGHDAENFRDFGLNLMLWISLATIVRKLSSRSASSSRSGRA